MATMTAEPEAFLRDLEASVVTCRRGEGFADRMDIRPADGRLSGRAVPYGHTVELLPGTLLERFEPGAFAPQLRDPSRVKICLEHGQVVGRARTLDEREDGLYFDGLVSDSPDIPEARRARALLGEELLDELSIGFATVAGGSTFETQDDGSTLVRHHRARLLEVSLVPFGMYGREATTHHRSRLVDPAVARLEARRAEILAWHADFRKRAKIR